jgi:hypothetical protein
LASIDEAFLILRKVRWLAVGSRVFVFIYVSLAIILIVPGSSFSNIIGRDFLTFWAASHLALSGEAAAAFDALRMTEAASFAGQIRHGLLLWHYPPTFHLIVLPLALLPYPAACAAWLASTLFAYVQVIRRLAPHSECFLLAIAFPAVFVNARIGQNGFLSTALFGGAMLLLAKRPGIAGALIGLLVYKPHLGLLVPVALIFGRQWIALASAGATAIGFVLLSAVVLGWECWAAFWSNIPSVGLRLDDGVLKWRLMPSVYIALRTLGFDSVTSYIAHAAIAIAAGALTAWIWFKCARLPLCAAVLVCATLLLPPYLFDYDLTLLAVPIAILAWDGVQHGWYRGERTVLVLAWLAPLSGLLGLQPTGIPAGSLCLVALFCVAARRALMIAAPEFGAIGTAVYRTPG